MKKSALLILIYVLSLSAEIDGFSQSAVNRSLFVYPSNPAALAAESGTSLWLRSFGNASDSLTGEISIQSPGFRLSYGEIYGKRYWDAGTGFYLLKGVAGGIGWDGYHGYMNWGVQISTLPMLNIGVKAVHEQDSPHLYPGIAIRLPGDRLTVGYQGFIKGRGNMEGSDLVYLSGEVARGIHAALEYEAGSGVMLLSLGMSSDHAFLSGSGRSDGSDGGFGFGCYGDFLRKAGGGNVVHRLILKGDYQEEYSGPLQKNNHFRDLLASLKNFERDKRSKALYIRVKTFSMGFVQLFQFQSALRSLKDEGKKLYLYGEGGNGLFLLMSSPADGSWLFPDGIYNLRGLRATRLYWKGLLDSVGVDAEISRIAEYKTAPENLIMDRMSDESRESLEDLLAEIEGMLIETIAMDRGLRQDSVKDLMHGGPYTLNEALAKGLFTEKLHESQVEKAIAKDLDVKKVNFADLREYSPEYGYRDDWDADAVMSNIAVIYAGGAIMDGKSSNGVMGAETIAARVQSAIKDPFIKAVVLRVDSPGGSTGASERIRYELEKLRKGEDRKGGKPLVVSMGNYAASGGYYISAEADYIYSEELTLTGSIGIYRTGFSIPRLLDKLHVRPQSVVTDSNALYMNPFYLESSAEKAFHYRSINEFYQNFLNIVSEGRGLERDALDSLAGGRVWTGRQAVDRGLADEIGTLQDAIEKAAELAEIPYKRIEPAHFYPYPGYRSSSLLMNMAKTKIRDKIPELLKQPDIYSATLFSEGSLLYFSPVRIDDINE